MTQAYKLLEALGVKFAMDFDGTIDIEIPPVIDGGEVWAAISRFCIDHKRQLSSEWSHDARRKIETFVGGPFHGKPNHGWGKHMRGYCETLKVARAKWAVYRQDEAGRAFFIGYAKSKAKGRRGNVYETAKECRRTQ